jgi:hypothetical protein
LALANAKRLLDLDLAIAAKTEEAAQIKEELKAYVKETGDKDLGVYTVTESEAKPKLNFGELTPNGQKRVVEILTSELPEFVKSTSTLDTEKMYYAMSSTPLVANTLKAHGLTFDLVSNLTFRKVK